MYCQRCGHSLSRAHIFCDSCGGYMVYIAVNLCSLSSGKEILSGYIKNGYCYWTMLMFLKTHHEVVMSIRTLH